MPKELTQQERLDEFRKELTDRRRGEPWYAIAARLDEAVEDALAAGYGEDTVKRLAVETTGLSVGVIGRYLSAYRRVKAAAAAAGMPMAELLSQGFNAIEVATRLYDRSESDGLKALKGLAAGNVGLADIKWMSSRSAPPDARSRTMRQRGLELQVIERALAARHKDSWVARRPPMNYFRHTGWEVRDGTGRCICGIDAMIARQDDPAIDIEPIIPAAALLSAYLPEYFLAISPSSPPATAEETIAALDFFDLPWIGVLKVEADLSVQELKPSLSPPDPGRSSSYETLRTKLTRRHAGDR